VIEAQLATGHESSSGFRDAFSHIMGAAPTKLNQDSIFKASWIDTPLGPMLALADEKALHLLEFVDQRGLEREIEQLRKKTQSAILPGSTDPILSIEKELAEYFKGKRMEFSTPLCTLGSAFQKRVWEELRKIPPGQTRSYSEIAKAIGQPSAKRAVARANGSNTLAIIIPCHRVINADGNLGGYAGGLSRKQWLLNHEFYTNPRK
jgi:AraC family transcriptional regulator of adaptative response/methylated-DNA-[protein]-cysteine methyltransferase